MSSNTVITLTGDDASAFKAFQRMVDQASKLGNATEKAAEKGKKAKESFADQQLGISSFTKLASSITVAAVATEGLKLLLSEIKADYERINQISIEQLDRSNKLASAQQEATKNLAGTDPEEMKRLLGDVVPRIAVEAKFADLNALTKAIGAAASIIGPDRAETVVAAAARLSALTPEQLQQTATATADVTKATGAKDAREALALLLSTGSVARPETLPQLATGAAKAINAGVIATSETQSQTNAAKESAALFAMLSEVDPSGNAASTATVQLIGQMRELFSEAGAVARSIQLEEMNEKRTSLDDQLQKQTVNVQLLERKAQRFGTQDTPEAESARIKAQSAANQVVRLQQSLARLDKEIGAIERIDVLKAADPGTTLGRIQAVSDDQQVRKFVLENLKGEAIFKPLFEGLLTKDSIQQEKVNKAAATTTMDVQVFEDALKTQDLTPQQKVARELQVSEALKARESIADPNLEIAQAIRQIRDNAINDTTLPQTLSGFYAKTLEKTFKGMLGDRLGSPQSEAEVALRMIDERVFYATPNVGGFTEEQKRQLELLDAQKAVISRLASIGNLSQNLEADQRVETIATIQQLQAAPGDAQQTNEMLRRLEAIEKSQEQMSNRIVDKLEQNNQAVREQTNQLKSKVPITPPGTIESQWSMSL